MKYLKPNQLFTKYFIEMEKSWKVQLMIKKWKQLIYKENCKTKTIILKMTFQYIKLTTITIEFKWTKIDFKMEKNRKIWKKKEKQKYQQDFLLIVSCEEANRKSHLITCNWWCWHFLHPLSHTQSVDCKHEQFLYSRNSSSLSQLIFNSNHHHHHFPPCLHHTNWFFLFPTSFHV